MTVIMRKAIGEKHLLQISASSAHGEGTLHVTSHAVIYEVYRRGIYLNFIPYRSIRGLYVSKLGMFGVRKCQLRWVDEQGDGDTSHFIDLRIRRYRDLESALRDCHDHS